MTDETNEDCLQDEAEKGFNDQELNDIMSEIEDLEKDLGVSSEAEPEQQASSEMELETEIESEIDTNEKVEATVSSETTLENHSDEVSISSELTADLDSDEPDLSIEDLNNEITNELSSNKIIHKEIDPEESMDQIVEDTIDEIENEVKSEIIDEIENEAVMEVVEKEFVDNVTPIDFAKKDNQSKNELNTLSKDSFGFNFAGEGKCNFKMNFPVGDKTVRFEVHPDNTFELDFDQVTFCVTEDTCVVTMQGGATFNLPLVNTTADKIKKAS